MRKHYIFIYWLLVMETFVHGDSTIKPIIGGQEIDLIVCINLDTRKDRELNMIKIMKEQGLPFRFFKAKLHQNPVQGCKESHLSVIKFAKEGGYKNVLILEDDIEFVKPLKESPVFPEKWEMLYFGGLMRNVLKNYQEWVAGLVICCQSYLINSTVFDAILSLDLNKNKEVDILFANTIHRNGLTFMTQQYFTKQTVGWSDIEKKYKWNNYKWPQAGEGYIVP